MNSKILEIDRRNWAKYLNISVKILLLLSFVIAIFGGLDSVEGKGMNLRAPFFLMPLWLVPLIAKLKKWDSYPHIGDALFTMPFLLDTLGNLFGLFDSLKIFDDILHALNWMFLIMSYQAFRFRKVSDNRDSILLGAGIGAIAIIIWEAIEWAVSVDGFGAVGNLQLSYEDTLGDLLLSTLGGFIGSILGTKLFGAKKSK
jgi:hypothetical protein